MVIIGLGSAGINIANKFKKWPQYKVILPSLDAYGTVEEQEENTPDFSDLFKNNNPIKIFKFLDEKTTVLEELSIFLSVDIKTFVRSLLKRISNLSI